MSKVSLFVCVIWVALSLGLLGCQRQRPSNIKFDETGFYILKEEEEDSVIDMTEDSSIPRIRP